MNPRLRAAKQSLERGRVDEAARLCADIRPGDAGHGEALALLGQIMLRKGDWAGAESLLRRSLDINANQPDVHANLGIALLRLGRAQHALESCEASLAMHDAHFEALNNRATALLALRRPDEALESYSQAARVAPHRREPRLARIHALIALGRLSDAVESACETLQAFPNDPDALHLRASAELGRNNAQEAVADEDRAFGLRAPSVPMLVTRGNAHYQLGQVEAALTDYEQAATMEPGNPDHAFNRGLALFGLQRFDAALAGFDLALRLRPGFAKALYHRGNALRRLGRAEEALASYTLALRAQPRYAAAVCGIGNVLRDLCRYDEALDAYQKALALEPQLVEALCNQGRVLLTLNRPAEAIGSLERMLAAAPDEGPGYNYALGMLLYARLACCDWRDVEPTIAAIEAGVGARRRVCLPSHLIAFSGSPELQLQCAKDFVEDNWARIQPPKPRLRVRGGTRIRLGYVSADFREHPVAMLLAGLFESHDRSRFEVFGISLRPEQATPLGRRVREAFDHYIDVTALADDQAAALMRELEIDIAVDLNGYTDGFRAGMFAYRAAPVQVAFVGFTGTTGAPYIDYLLADRVVIPDSERRHYSEAIAYLPGCYLPNDHGRDPAAPTLSRSAYGLPAEGFVFCCFNNPHKMQPALFRLWMRILSSVDGSLLWLNARSEMGCDNLRREAAKHGVDPARLVFAPRIPGYAEHLARYRVADLFLDTLPFNAHTTAVDALWAGVPVLTCSARTFAGRVATSLLHSVGLPELAAASPTEYEALAIRLANEPSLLARYRNRLSMARTSGTLFDANLQRAHLESAFETMWKRQQAAEPFKDFEVPARSASSAR